MSTLEASKLRDSILSERDCGIVTMDVRALDALSVDAYVTTFGFKPLADSWCLLDRKSALRVLQRVLERDLAYDSPLMDAARARSLGESFLSLFSTTAKYYTNGSLEPGSSGWNPITDSTFDHGVVAHDDHTIGIIWVQDED